MVIQGPQPKRTAAERQFAFWLTTQTNAQGRTYRAYIASRYAARLRTEPFKLDIPLPAEERDIYRCRTLPDFDRLDQIFRGASNFQNINREADNGVLSAGLSAYRKYVQYLERGGAERLEEPAPLPEPHGTRAAPQRWKSEVKRVDFRAPDACSGCDPVSCAIGTKSFSVRNWRDILVEFTEYFLATKKEAQDLVYCSLYPRGTRPFLLKDRPDAQRTARQISTGHWIYLNLGISALVSAIGRLCEFCGVSLEKVDIRYVPKGGAESSTSAAFAETPVRLPEAIPYALLEKLGADYPSGFRFETTYLNLLSQASGVSIDTQLQKSLQKMMFHRKDDIFYLPDHVTDETTRAEIISLCDDFLLEYGCFEPSELYQMYRDRLNPACIRDAEDFEYFLGQIARKEIRCVSAPRFKNRIVRLEGRNVWTIFNEIAKKIVKYINEKHYGSCEEKCLHEEFHAFSKDLLGKIIRHCAAGILVRVEINNTICYQSFAALGLPEDFSEILSAVLDRLEEIDLLPSQETLHTAISLRLGMNFKSEFNLPDWDTYRRLISAYYKGHPCREWRNNVFGEVDN